MKNKILLLVAVISTPVYAILGDLNEDGRVDFQDFFIFSDNFGKSGPVDSSIPDTVVVTVRDTLEQIIIRETTVRDTVELIREVTINDTLFSIQTDTLFLTEVDTLILVQEVTVHDTIVQTIVETIVDSIIVPIPLESSDELPPELGSWSEVVNLIRPSLYWIGYTARPQDGTRFNVTFVGTGFAVAGDLIATNYHVGSAVDDGFKGVFSHLSPFMIAVRSGTQIYGSETYQLGGVQDRSLLGFWHPDYDFSVFSPDIALFTVQALDANFQPQPISGNIEFLETITLDQAMDIQVGDEVGILGFPGVLETSESPFNLVPNPTFKTGTVSSLRAYDESTQLTSDWRIALAARILQHNIETAPGNSGSPIFNKRGQIVAIHNSGIPGGESFNFGIRGDGIRLMLKALWTGRQRPNFAQHIHPNGDGDVDVH